MFSDAEGVPRDLRDPLPVPGRVGLRPGVRGVVVVARRVGLPFGERGDVLVARAGVRPEVLDPARVGVPRAGEDLAGVRPVPAPGRLVGVPIIDPVAIWMCPVPCPCRCDNVLQVRMARHPSQLVVDFLGGCDQHGGIAGTTRCFNRCD
jgi:hypothetical protein